MNIIVGQNESLPNIKGQIEAGWRTSSNPSKGAFKLIGSATEFGGGSSKFGLIDFNASKTLDERGNEIANPTYKDGAKVTTKNFTYKNWIRIL